MKDTKTNAITGRYRAKRNGAANPVGKASPSGSGRGNWGIALVVVLLVAAGTFALFEFVILSKLPRELVGRWRVVGGQMDGFVMEFSRNGTMTGRKNASDVEPILEGRAEVNGTKLRTTTVNP